MTIEKDNESMDFAKKLKKLRQQKGWSQGQLAKKIDSDLQRISKYERGVVTPTTEMAAKIAVVFEVSLDYLILDKEISTTNVENEELLHRLEEIDKLPNSDQDILINLIDAYIKRRKFETLAKQPY